MVKRGVIMKYLEYVILRCNILFRKNLLNLLLMILSPTNKLVVALSQNLDKYIVLYQKKSFFKYKYNHNSSPATKKIAA